MHCPECGAHYASGDDSCRQRFDQLLALDHSRREPWGSRHGQAFAAFALQHPAMHARSVERAWAALYRVYVLGEAPRDVFASYRAGAAKRDGAGSPVPTLPNARSNAPTITIADLGDFAAATYPARLDEWCRATLESWGVTIAPANR